MQHYTQVALGRRALAMPANRRQNGSHIGMAVQVLASHTSPNTPNITAQCYKHLLAIGLGLSTASAASLLACLVAGGYVTAIASTPRAAQCLPVNVQLHYSTYGQAALCHLPASHPVAVVLVALAPFVRKGLYCTALQLHCAAIAAGLTPLAASAAIQAAYNHNWLSWQA